MDLSVTLDGITPLEQLRHMQLLLKREDVFLKFQAKEIQQMTVSLKEETPRVLFLQKFFFFLHMCSLGKAASKLSPKFMGSIFRDLTEKAQPPSGKSNVVNMYNKAIISFANSQNVFAKAVAEIIRTRSEYANQLTFSIIPAFFSYLWNASSFKKFVEFLKYIYEIAPDILASVVRVVFIIPQFRQFFDAILEGYTSRICNADTEEKADAIADELVERWREDCEFCPDIIKEVLSISSDPAGLLSVALITQVFDAPRSFGIIPISHSVPQQTINLVKNALIKRSSDIWNIIKDAEPTITLPSTETLSTIMHESMSCVSFTASDLSTLIVIVDCANRIAPDFPVKPSQLDFAGLHKSSGYEVFGMATSMTQEEVVSKNASNVVASSEDEIEMHARELLVGIDVISPSRKSEEEPDLLSLFKYQTELVSINEKLRLQMITADLENSMKKKTGKIDFREVLDLLKTKFEERRPMRHDKLAMISTYNTEHAQTMRLSKTLRENINHYRTILKFSICEKWVNDANPLYPDEGLTVKDVKLYTDPSVFVEFFFNVVANWKKWCADNEYDIPLSYEMIHNVIMAEISLDQFLEVHPEYAIMDEECYSGLVNDKEKFLMDNTFDFMAVFHEHPKLLDGAMAQLNQAFDSPLPTTKLAYFRDALHTLVLALSLEGQKEIGADQWLPMCIFLLVLTAPKRFPSTMLYLAHFVKPIMEHPKSEDRLISDQTEYTYVMVKSALMQFQRSMPGIEFNFDFE